MGTFEITDYNQADGPFEGAEVTMEITPTMEKTLAEDFGLEVELLQADRKPHPDGSGRSILKFTIMDEEKAELLREFVLKVISQSHKQNMN